MEPGTQNGTQELTNGRPWAVDRRPRQAKTIMSDADLEYGPTPENAEHEHTDIEPSIAEQVRDLAGGGDGAFGGYRVRDVLAVRRAGIRCKPRRADVSARGGPGAPAAGPRPANPAVQRHLPAAQRPSARNSQPTAGSIKAPGVVRIPIEDALRLMSERGTVTSSPQTPAGLNHVVQDSSSGRTVAPRY